MMSWDGGIAKTVYSGNRTQQSEKLERKWKIGTWHYTFRPKSHHRYELGKEAQQLSAE